MTFLDYLGPVIPVRTAISGVSIMMLVNAIKL